MTKTEIDNKMKTADILEKEILQSTKRLDIIIQQFKKRINGNIQLSK